MVAPAMAAANWIVLVPPKKLAASMAARRVGAVNTPGLTGVTTPGEFPVVSTVKVEEASPLLLRLKLAGSGAPGAVAATMYGPPTVLLAVTARLTVPPAAITAMFVAGAMPAPLAGPVKVTT